MTKMPSISKKGNNTKNHEMALYPLEHKKFKNHVQATIKIPFATSDIISKFLNSAITRLIAAKTRYTIAGVQSLEKSIIYINNIINNLNIRIILKNNRNYIGK